MTTQSLEVAHITDDEESVSADADGISPQFTRQPWICEGLKRCQFARTL